MTTNIYILKLQNDKWYIGKSDNPEKRFLQHKNGSGSAWTSRHKPIDLYKVIENVSPFQEDAFTKEYMNMYGIDNVRGGSYTQIILPDEQKKLIQRELWSMKNLCNNCGSSEHWVSNCSTEQEPVPVIQTPILQMNNKPIIQINTQPIFEFFSKVNNEFTNSNSDLRSGRFFNSFFRTNTSA